MTAHLPVTPRDAARPGAHNILHRRRGLPNGRAVFGALLLTVAGVGTFAAASHDADASAVRYVIVARPVAPGARITADDLAERAMSLDPLVAENAFTDRARLTGAVALAPLGPGQLVQRAEVATAPSVDGQALPPAHELTIAVSADRLPTGLRRGERVAVLATYGTGTDARTVVTVQQAVVLAVGEAGDSLANRGSARLTVALEDAGDVVGTAHAAQVAELTIVRTTLADGELPASYLVEPATTTRPATTGARSGP